MHLGCVILLIYCCTSQINRAQFRCCIALVTSDRCRNTRILWLLFVWNDSPRLLKRNKTHKKNQYNCVQTVESDWKF